MTSVREVDFYLYFVFLSHHCALFFPQRMKEQTGSKASDEAAAILRIAQEEVSETRSHKTTAMDILWMGMTEDLS